jgi:hypothetical protein
VTPHDLTFGEPRRQGDILQFTLAPRDTMDGWFSLGRVHLIGGSSGTGKTTLISKVLYRQERGEIVFGHQGLRRRSLVLFADRGSLSNKETLMRLRIDPDDLTMDYISDGVIGLDAVQEIITLIEGHDVPEVVFIEAADALVEDQNKPQCVLPFMKGLQRVAEHFHCAIILSVGAPKTRNGDKHGAQRDRIIGSEKWGRLAECVLTLEFVSGGNGTENERILTVQHRNAPAEAFMLQYAHDGSELIEKPNVPEIVGEQDRDLEAWMRSAGDFSKQAFREQFKLSGSNADLILNGYHGEGKLRRVHKGKRYRWRA